MLSDLADSPDAASYEHGVLTHFGATVGFDVGFFAMVAGSAPTTIGIDAAALADAIATDRYAHELLPLKQRAFASRSVVVDTEVFGLEAVRRTGYHRDFAAPVGGKHTLLAWLVLRGRPLGLVMLGRTGGAFSARDVDLVASALPSIALARASYHAPIIADPLPYRRAAVGVEWGGLRVRDRDGMREMLSGDLVWTRARLDQPKRSGWFYVDLFHLAAARARRRDRALFVGCGGAVAVRQFAETYPGIALDVVEIDPRVVKLADDYFGLTRIPNVRVHVGDAAAFIARAELRSWDVVVVDAFGEDLELPASFTTRGFAREVRRVLRAGGALAMNAIGSLREGSAVRSLERVLRAELDDVRVVPVLDAGEAFSASATRNVVLIAGVP